MLYKLLRPIIGFATRRFFREIHFTGEPIESGPVLIAANHPNVMLDAQLVLLAFRRDIWFIVKATIFRSVWINWLLRSLHFIPIHRRQDNPTGAQLNDEIFGLVADRLGEGRAVLIFPEGQSMATRQILEVKTGAARIAFLAEQKQQFDLGLKIQPVGITYSDFFRYNSSVTVTCGSPISVAEYIEQFKQEPDQAVRALTDRIRDELKRATVEVVDLDESSITEKIAKLYRSKRLGKDDHQRFDLIAKNVHEVFTETPARVKELNKRLTHYLQLSTALKIDGSEDLESPRSRVFMVLACPFILSGIVLHMIPYRITYRLSRLWAKHPSQLSSYALSFGFFVFSFWTMLIGIVAGIWSDSGRIAFLAIFFTLVSGYYTTVYFNQFALFIFSMLWPGRKTPVDVLRLMRDDLFEDIEDLRVLN